VRGILSRGCHEHTKKKRFEKVSKIRNREENIMSDPKPVTEPVKKPCGC
jgi:hypothetical protein